MAPTCFGLRPSSGSLQLSLAKVILILKHSVKLRHYLLCSDVAACTGMACILCAVLCTAHNTHAILGYAATQLHTTVLCTAHNTHAILGYAATQLHNTVLCTAHNTHAILGYAATPLHNK